jgi:peptidoglycan/LPS O-acetylase OafA/YrhL
MLRPLFAVRRGIAAPLGWLTSPTSVSQRNVAAARERGQPFRLGYRPALDGLRGLAVLGVIAVHVNLLEGGGIGVDVFFVLSGFLITSLLLEEWDRTGSVDFRSFYIRRALRLLPALLVVLATVALLVVLAQVTTLRGFGQPELNGIVTSFFYVTNYARALGLDVGALHHTWSLAIEEQFYILWPPLLVFLLRRRLNRLQIAGGLVAVMLVIAAWRALSWKLVGFDWAFHTLDAHADGLAAGCVVACVATAGLLPAGGAMLRLLQLSAMAGAAFLLLATATLSNLETPLYAGGYTIVVTSSALIVAALMATQGGFAHGVLGGRPLVLLGRISYGVYLWHYLVVALLTPEGAVVPEGAGPVAAVFAISIGVAATSYYLLEQRVLRLKNRFRRLPEGVPA